MQLNEFFKTYPKAALAFSGGTDSAYLLYEAVRSNVDIAVYYVSSEFQPKFELEDAKRLCRELGVRLNIIELEILDCDEIAKNPRNRCYYCKKMIMSSILKQAQDDGYEVILDGTNASDDANDRPGMKAIAQMGVLSPLKICGLTKADVRSRSREAGLFTWDKPAYACLATRIQSNVPIDIQTLERIEKAEDALMKMGFSDLRVRVFGGTARLQVKASQMQMVIDRRDEILEAVGAFFNEVFLDLRAR